MTAARKIEGRTLTDEDVEAIADAIIRKTRPLRARAIPPREPPTRCCEHDAQWTRRRITPLWEQARRHEP